VIEVIRSSIAILFIGIVVSIPGFLFSLWAAKNGFARPIASPIIVLALCSALIKQVWFENVSWVYFGVLTLLAVTIGINRADLWTTFKQGRWWWKLKGNDKDT